MTHRLDRIESKRTYQCSNFRALNFATEAQSLDPATVNQAVQECQHHRRFPEFCELTGPMRQPTWLFGGDVLSEPPEDLREFLQWLSQEQQTWQGSSGSGFRGEAVPAALGAGAETLGDKDKVEDGRKTMGDKDMVEDGGKTVENGGKTMGDKDMVQDGGKTKDMVQDGGKTMADAVQEGTTVADKESVEEALKRQVQENRAKALEAKRQKAEAASKKWCMEEDLHTAAKKAKN